MDELDGGLCVCLKNTNLFGFCLEASFSAQSSALRMRNKQTNKKQR